MQIIKKVNILNHILEILRMSNREVVNKLHLTSVERVNLG